MNKNEYGKKFGLEPKCREKLEKALDHALDIRKFEIELYWKRATYFWTLIASAFAAYFIILNAKNMDSQKLMAFVVANVGFVFTFAWLQVNRGSKRWQENWENHVDLLEDSVIGPLYKTILSRPDNADSLFEKWVTGPGNISVSKTNQIVNLFTALIWLFLAANTLEGFAWNKNIAFGNIVVATIAISTCILISWQARTHMGTHGPTATLRVTAITE